jgi:BMFP domain-containing protein YqiC
MNVITESIEHVEGLLGDLETGPFNNLDIWSREMEAAKAFLIAARELRHAMMDAYLEVEDARIEREGYQPTVTFPPLPHGLMYGTNSIVSGYEDDDELTAQ